MTTVQKPMSAEHTDIAIIGGGMVGVSLALLLAGQPCGWKITLIEAFPFAEANEPVYQPSFDARSSAIAAGSVELLKNMGVWDRLVQHATAIRRVHVSDRGHFGGTEICAEDYKMSAVGYVVENRWLGSVLASALRQAPNINLLAPARVSSLQANAAGYCLQLTADNEGPQPATLQAKLAVIADGEHSSLRQRLGIATQVIHYQQQAIIANVRLSQPHGGVAYERFNASGPIALLPLGEADTATTAALVWTRPLASAAHWAACSEGEFLAELQRQFGFRAGYFTGVGARHAYPLSLIQAQEQVRRGLVLVGNAAHFLHPVAGQGFNLSLRDCAALADVLVQGAQAGHEIGDLAVLQRYVQRQTNDQHVTVDFSNTLVRLFSSSSLPLAVLRNLGLLALESVPVSKHWLGLQTMGAAGYRPRLSGSHSQSQLKSVKSAVL